MSAPRLEIDLDQIVHNARTLVERLADRGISVTGVTKATLGSADIAAALLRAGVRSIGDSRIENIESMRCARVPASMTLIRSPMLSQASRVVAHADVSFNSELDVISQLSQAAQEATEHFKSLFGSDKRNEIPADAPVFKQNCPPEGVPILTALLDTDLIKSNGEGKRLIKQGGLVVNGERANDLQMYLQTGEYALRAGKKRWARLIIT